MNRLIDRHIALVVVGGFGLVLLALGLWWGRPLIVLGYFIWMSLYCAYKSDEFFNKYLDARYGPELR